MANQNKKAPVTLRADRCKKQSTENKSVKLLPPELESLLEDYQYHCKKNGLREGSIATYSKECRWFLENLPNSICDDGLKINSSAVVTSCLALESNSYLSTIRTFLRFLASEGYTNKDYSYVIPPYKRPQLIPSVYSEEEIRQMEVAITRNSPPGKRDYAILLIASRLGIRSGDIAALKFNQLDFNTELIHFVQQKTLAPLELPMLEEIKTALLDYIHNERPSIDNQYIFLTCDEPFRKISVQSVWKRVYMAMRKADIDTCSRGCGPRALRSSLASSMVNDDIPYEAVRRTLGHNDPNAISHYARLDVEQLRFYALPIPQAVGVFEDFLSGRGGL